MQTIAPQPIAVQLPSGFNPAEYEDWENWSYTRWAWEYLRRNDEFRKECHALGQIKGTEARRQAKARIRDKFILRRFKHCDEPYSVGKPAQFRGIKRSPRASTSTTTEWIRPLTSDEVCIAFKLRPAIYGSSAIKAQLKLAEKIIEKRAALFREEFAITAKPTAPRGNAKTHLHKLRLLDLHRQEKSWIEIAKILLTRGKVDPADQAESERKLYEVAIEITNFGYLALLTAPITKKKMPAQTDGQ